MQSHKQAGVPPHIAFQGKYGPENHSFDAFFFLPFLLTAFSNQLIVSFDAQNFLILMTAEFSILSLLSVLWCHIQVTSYLMNFKTKILV